MKNEYRKFPKKGKIGKFIFKNDSIKIDFENCKCQNMEGEEK